MAGWGLGGRGQRWGSLPLMGSHLSQPRACRILGHQDRWAGEGLYLEPLQLFFGNGVQHLGGIRAGRCPLGGLEPVLEAGVII